MQIVLADDHNLVRDGLKPFLRELAADVEVLDAASLDEALAAVRRAQDLGLVLLDLNMPGMNGLAGLEAMRAACPGVPVVIVSGQVERDSVLGAMHAGASGFIPKTISGSNLINALRLILAGETYLPPSVLAEAPDPGHSLAATSQASPLATLSPREREILGYLIEGMTNKAIARELDLQEITIKIHLRNVYRKIGAANRAQAVRIALSSGWGKT